MCKKTCYIIFLVLLLLLIVGCTKNEFQSGDNSSLSTIENSDSVADNSEFETTEETNKNDIVSDTNKNYSDEKNDTNKWNEVEEKITAASVIDNESTNKEDTTHSQVKADKDIVTVIFKDYDGTVLKEEKIKKGEDATAPNKPSRDGYRFIKWDTVFENVKVNITVTAVYEEITLPTFIVDEVSGKSGDTVCVTVSVQNNPGVLGMVLNITYDESVMKLKESKNGSAMSEYMFTPPKNMKSGCNAAWNINDIPDGNQDGEVLTLYFEVIKNASKGSYPIAVSCINNAFDNDYNVVAFDVINGALNIE